MRGVIHSKDAAEAYDDACEKWARADDAWLAAEWTIVHDPMAGMAMNEGGTVRAFTFEGAKSIGLPTLTIVYGYDRRNITIYNARFVEPTATRFGRA